MFATGKITSSGAKNEFEAKNAISEPLKEIAEIGCINGSANTSEIKIENIVGTADLNHEIDLESISSNLGTYTYEPEQFPGVIFRFKNGRAVCLIFSTGKIVVVGVKSEKELIQAFSNLVEILN